MTKTDMTERFDYLVECDGDEALVAMNLGESIVTARTMPRITLVTMSKACRYIPEEYISKVTADTVRDVAEVRCIIIASGSCGACDVKVGASRRSDGEPECFVAFYDEGDDEAPVLLLIEEQIEEFVSRVEAITKG